MITSKNYLCCIVEISVEHVILELENEIMTAN